MNTIRKFLFPEYFFQFANGKFFTIGRYFIFWVIATTLAAVRMAYEGKYDINSFNAADLVYLPLILGAIYHFCVKISPDLRVLEISEDHWRSKLASLWKTSKTSILSKEETQELKDLSELWFYYYDIAYGEALVVKSNKFLPWIWIAFIFLNIWLFVW